MKIYDFPATNRGKSASRDEYRGYLKKYKGEVSERRFANFHLLLYISDLLDIDTAMAIANLVSVEAGLDSSLIELLEGA